jgi:hypothetical protein
MPKRSSKPKRDEDTNETAFRVMREATTGTPTDKNPAAVALGRLGGLKGGKARAANLTAAERKKIAQKAARARWGRSRGS